MAGLFYQRFIHHRPKMCLELVNRWNVNMLMMLSHDFLVAQLLRPHLKGRKRIITSFAFHPRPATCWMWHCWAFWFLLQQLRVNIHFYKDFFFLPSCDLISWNSRKKLFVSWPTFSIEFHATAAAASFLTSPFANRFFIAFSERYWSWHGLDV
jgi:hypothetical protein